jgi:tetratricopeptide (TPR) repeat protein
MKRTLWLGFTLLGPISVTAAAQTAGLELRGVVFSVEDGQADRKYLANVLVTVVDFGVSGTTNDQGGFRVRLPAGVLPGQDVTLEKDLKDYYILFPVLSKLRVPANSAQLVEVQMAPKGSKVLLGANFIEQFITFTADDSAKKPKDPKGRAPDLSSYVNELVSQSGRPAEEILGQISQWAAEAKESDDPRKLGLAAFAEKKFHLAAENFRKAADAEKRRGAEGYRRSAKDRQLEGDSYSNALDFANALKAYQTAQSDLAVYRKGCDDLGLPPYPEYTSDVRNLAFKIANVKVDLGIRVAGTDSQRYLKEAIQAYNSLMSEIPKNIDPQFWAMTQNNLGIALWSLGKRQGGAEEARNLAEAVQAFRQALTVFTRDALPQEWATTQNNLAGTLWSLGERQEGAEGVRRLAEAVQAFREALTVFTRDALPHDWAKAQNNLGTALRSLAKRQGGAEEARNLAEAVQAFRESLTVFNRDALPQEWATTQSNLGCTLWSLGERQGGAEGTRKLAEAVQAFRESLTVFNRDALPQQWATTQNNLANSLKSLGERQGDTEGVRHLAEAVQAFRQALTVFTRDALPQEWAKARNNLGNALKSLGERQGGAEGAQHLAEAVQAFQEALTVFNRDALPQEWARTQHNLGTTLLRLCVVQQGDAERARLLAETVEAYNKALAIYTHDVLPQEWATTQNNLGLALQLQIALAGFPKGLELVDRVSQAEGMRDDPVAQASLRTLAVLCHVASDQSAEARRTLGSLVALVEHQPDDFHLVWNWAPLRTLVTESKAPSLSAHRESLQKLIDAVGRGNKATILAALKEVRDAFGWRGDEPASSGGSAQRYPPLTPALRRWVALR